MELMICRVWIIFEFVETAETVEGGGGYLGYRYC